jgi:hypothetical protein
MWQRCPSASSKNKAARAGCWAYCSTLKIEAVHPVETSTNLYYITRRHIFSLEPRWSLKEHFHDFQRCMQNLRFKRGQMKVEAVENRRLVWNVRGMNTYQTWGQHTCRKSGSKLHRELRPKFEKLNVSVGLLISSDWKVMPPSVMQHHAVW